MTDAQFHSYRFNDESDPTDEQLAELMRQASQSDIDALSPGIYIIGGKKVIVK